MLEVPQKYKEMAEKDAHEVSVKVVMGETVLTNDDRRKRIKHRRRCHYARAAALRYEAALFRRGRHGRFRALRL